MTKRMIEYCPFCEFEHELDYIEDVSTIEIKGQIVEYESHYYYCPKHPEEKNGFVNGKMMDENLARARNSYRTHKKLLTSDEIVAIRKQYGLSQVELANMLGWGGATISRYESKQIQDETHDELLKEVRDNPMFAYKSLLRNKENFSTERFNSIKNCLMKIIDQNSYLGRELLKSYYVPYEELSVENGNKILDIDKLVACISYIASKIELYKTKCMKLLWYIDSVSYKERGEALTGLVYCHQEYGALPIGTIMELKDVIVESIINDEGYEAFRIYPNEEIDSLAILTKEDVDIINRIIEKFGQMKSNKLVEYMHKEKAYINTQVKQVISFEYAKELNEF